MNQRAKKWLINLNKLIILAEGAASTYFVIQFVYQVYKPLYYLGIAFTIGFIMFTHVSVLINQRGVSGDIVLLILMIPQGFYGTAYWVSVNDFFPTENWQGDETGTAFLITGCIIIAMDVTIGAALHYIKKILTIMKQ